MPLSTAEITYNLANLVGIPHHAGTSVTASTNIPRDTVVDTDGNAIRLGSGKGSIDSNGAGSIDVWVPGEGSNPASWQTYIHVRYRDPLANRGHDTRTFGPFTITASGDLADLIDEQEVPPTYITTLTAELDEYATNAANSAAVAQSAADLATAVSGADAADDLITILEADPGSDFRISQDARLSTTIASEAVLEGSAFADIGKQSGVDPTGVTECAAAIQTALTGFAALGVRAYARGTFKIGSTVTITGDADLGDATFNYQGSNTSVAVQVGSGVSGGTGILFRKRIVLPKVINTNKVGTGWAGTSVGVRAVNTYACQIIVPRVRGFVTGYYADALGTGNVYNDVAVLHLDNNKRNLVLGAGTAGWSNSNTYRLGILAHESAEGTNVAGTRAILLETATNVVNGNLFIGGSVEGNTAEYHLDCDGLYNRFDEVRWENGGSGCRIIWRANGSRNVVSFGYTAHLLVETHVAGSSLNRVMSTGMSRMVGSTSKAVQWLENSSSSTAAVDAVMDPGATIAGSDPATAYRVYRTADATKMKRATDAFDRLRLDHTNGRVYWGPGTADPTIYIGMIGSSNIALSGSSLVWLTDNTQDIGFAGANRPRYVRAGTAVVTGALTTAGRPTAATAGAGAHYFDTTLGKPVWSTGTTWVDATGATV